MSKEADVVWNERMKASFAQEETYLNSTGLKKEPQNNRSRFSILRKPHPYPNDPGSSPINRKPKPPVEPFG
jgi:hypothetical protein